MSEMISVATGFQYSVNIGYDLNDDTKLKNFIPTQSALGFLEEILLSTAVSSTERARILIGTYGKGKSHIVLAILSILLKKDLTLFEKLLPKLKENEELFQLVKDYYKSNNKILPVVITGSNTNLIQAFLLTLQRVLSENELLDVMPETNYHAAISAIERWQKNFPNTYKQLESALDEPVSEMINRLKNFDISAYENFERIYPSLTAGSVFNPFLGFDVAELYESVAQSLQKRGYTGLYVVYDEFSKYLESNTTEGFGNDMKMLQDLAEKCNRSGELQLHLMLICHKEVDNYIDRFLKQKVDGWRGVSKRLKDVYLNNNFSQSYEVITSVIQKQPTLWNTFQKSHSGDFQNISQKYHSHPLFDKNEEELQLAVYGCYPLHPVSTFILPRLSERVAQNERTLFTFLSSEGTLTLRAFLDRYNDDIITFITPDSIYDYFEPLFKKEIYSSDIHENYVLTSAILSRLPENSLESKIIKTISLIYMLQQFERLKPTKDEIVDIFSTSYSTSEILETIDKLIEKEFVIYLKRSNHYLRLKQASGVDVHQKISDFTEANRSRVSVRDILNSSNFDNYMYPSRYNDDREMTRFFSFIFIDQNEVTAETDWAIKSEAAQADGVIFAVIPHDEEFIQPLKELLLRTSRGCSRQIFILPKHFFEIESTVREYQATLALREEASEDPVLFSEYDIIYEDLRDIINGFLALYAQPEHNKATYIFDGELQSIHRKAALTELLSKVCDYVYSDTPVISNEALNRNEITGIAANSRNKIVAALLRTQLERNLGLSGTGQEVSIMRSTLMRTGILSKEDVPHIVLHPNNRHIANMMETIERFLQTARSHSSLSFDTLYTMLMSPEHHIGLRRGLIPIYLAAVFHVYKQQIMISDRFGEVAITADTLLQINADPSAFTVSYIDWNPEKQAFIDKLSVAFSTYIVDAERSTNAYDYVASAMHSWMMALPKFAKECTVLPSGERINREYQTMMRLLRQNENGYNLLFVKLPKAFGYENAFPKDLADKIVAAKMCYDGIMDQLQQVLSAKSKFLFIAPQDMLTLEQMSLASVIQDWCETLDQAAFSHLFPDGAEKVLQLFQTVTNDEGAFVTKLAKTVTGLRPDDWNSKTIEIFTTKLSQYKETAESYHKEHRVENPISSKNYTITFINEDSSTTTRSFERVETSGRGKLLHNQITRALEAMGQSISEQEKRQILIEILQNLC